MKATVYIETTVVSYLTCRPSRDVIRLSHEMITRDWWAAQRHRFELFASQQVIQEASAGDPAAAAARLHALEGIPLLPVIEPVVTLAEHVARGLQLPPRARADAVHVAVAAVHGMSFLLTWNCRHLANAALTDKIERSCTDAGFVAPRIVTPELLMSPE